MGCQQRHISEVCGGDPQFPRAIPKDLTKSFAMLTWTNDGRLHVASPGPEFYGLLYWISRPAKFEAEQPTTLTDWAVIPEP
jgi:hypothetical protein